jgi:transposase-like protein
VANNGVRYSGAFRLAAVERTKSCETVVTLAKELGVDKRQLYRWRALLEPAVSSQEPPPETSRESLLMAENAHLKRALGEMTLEAK